MNASPTLNKKTNPNIPAAIAKPFFLKKLVIGPLIVPPIQVNNCVSRFLFLNLFEINLSFSFCLLYLSISFFSLINIKPIFIKITKIPKINQESLQIVKYNKGGFYKEHYDACSYDAEMCKNMNKNSGQRITTLLIYLNDNFEGGETKFTHEKVNLSVKPEKGMAVLFYNVSSKDNNIVHPLSIHTGTELLSGEKWICNVWSHKNKF